MKWVIGTILLGIIIIFFVFLKRKQDEVEASFQNRFAGKNIKFMDKYALYVARLSDGYSHFRGNGYLVLTDDELYFERQLDRKTFITPVSSIINAESTKRLGGQSPDKMMLISLFSYIVKLGVISELP